MNKPRINPFSKDLFTALADVQFQQIVTTRMLPTLYICGIIFAGIAALYLVASTWTENSWPARIAWCGIFAPALFMASVVAWRIILELCFSFFQILKFSCSKNTTKSQNPRVRHDVIDTDPIMIQFDKWTVMMRITINMDIQIYHSGIENMVRQFGFSDINYELEV